MRIRLTLILALLSLAVACAAAPLAVAQTVGPPECTVKAFVPVAVTNAKIVGRASASGCTAPITVSLRVCLQERAPRGRYRSLSCVWRKRELQPEDALRVRTRGRACTPSARYRSVARLRVGSAPPVTRRSRPRSFCAVR
jgi:hypothetical protein